MVVSNNLVCWKQLGAKPEIDYRKNLSVLGLEMEAKKIKVIQEINGKGNDTSEPWKRGRKPFRKATNPYKRIH